MKYAQLCQLDSYDSTPRSRVCRNDIARAAESWHSRTRLHTTRNKKKDSPDLFGFSQPAGLRVWSIPPVLFQVFGPGGRRRGARLDHRIPVDVVAIGRRNRGNAITSVSHGITTRGSYVAGVVSCIRGGLGGGLDGAGATTVVVDVGNNYGVCGTIRPVAIGPPEQPQHNIRRKR